MPRRPAGSGSAEPRTEPTAAVAPPAKPLPKLRWEPIVAWALVGATVVLLLICWDLNKTGVNVMNLIQPGHQGPSHAAFEHDFPNAYFPDGEGHDGQQFYAVARNPLHPTEVAADLGQNPRYRLQRILFPALAWVLHPSGGGYGLITALLIVGAAAVVGGGVAAGALSVTLGGPPWGALAFALMPGVYFGARITTADGLAMALVLGALVLSLRERWIWAIVLGIAAVLAREVSIVPLIGLALWRRDQAGVLLVAGPLAVAGAWFVTLRAMFPGIAYGSDRAAFLSGVRPSVHYWFSTRGFGSGATVVAAVVLVAAALIWRFRSPLAWPIVLSSVLPLFLNAEAIHLFDNLSRVLLPSMVLAALALLGRNGFRAPPGRWPLPEPMSVLRARARKTHTGSGRAEIERVATP